MSTGVILRPRVRGLPFRKIQDAHSPGTPPVYPLFFIGVQRRWRYASDTAMRLACREFGWPILMLAMLLAFVLTGGAAIRDGGIDPANLGKGDWVYYVSDCRNQLGGNV